MCRFKVLLKSYRQKRSFCGFETSFTALVVLFLTLWRLFWVDQRYRCPDTGENVHLPAFKPVLLHSLFYFLYFWGYFKAIKSTFAKIQSKTFICGLLNRFYDICCWIFSTLEFIFSWLKVPLQKFVKKWSFNGFETSFTAFAVLFLALGGYFE